MTDAEARQTITEVRLALAMVEHGTQPGDHFDRLKVIQDAARRLGDLAEALSSMRQETVRVIHEPGPKGWGWSQARIAQKLGLSRSRVHQMIHGGKP